MFARSNTIFGCSQAANVNALKAPITVHTAARPTRERGSMRSSAGGCAVDSLGKL